MTHYRFHLIDNIHFDAILSTPYAEVFKIFRDESTAIRINDQHEGGHHFMVDKSKIVAIEVISNDDDAE